MTESSLSSFIIRTNWTSDPQTWVRRLVWKIALATIVLMAIGSATRVMNAGLACPDWPLCYGQLIPTQQMNLQVFLEWFHRLDASLIGFSMIIVTAIGWWQRPKLPTWLPFALIFALLLVVLQGILGGLTVTQLLRFDIVTAHLAIAMTFFCTLIVIAINLKPTEATNKLGKLAWLSTAATVIVYLQSILGGLVASRWALHQCFDDNRLCTVMNSHIIGVFPATLTTLAVVLWCWFKPDLPVIFRQLSWILTSLILLQIILGIATFRLHLQVEPLTVAHHTIGVALLGTLVAFTSMAWRNQTNILKLKE